jgi:antitoxin Phd
VKKDSINALACVKHGVIAWHDYGRPKFRVTKLFLIFVCSVPGCALAKPERLSILTILTILTILYQLATVVDDEDIQMNSHEKGSILIVEHNPSIRHSYSKRLSEAGFQVAEAAEATDALRRIKKDEFDLLISGCNVNLPQMGGLTLLRRARAQSRNLQLVLVLESANNQIAVQAAELGVFQSLIKPLKPGILEKTASLAIRRQREWTRSWGQAQRPAHIRRDASVTATEAKKEFGRVLEKAIQGSGVVMTKHDTPKAVLLSVDEFNSLSHSPELEINALSAEFDVLLARMQQSGARGSMQAAFSASPQQLGRAAIAAARKRG